MTYNTPTSTHAWYKKTSSILLGAFVLLSFSSTASAQQYDEIYIADVAVAGLLTTTTTTTISLALPAFYMAYIEGHSEWEILLTTTSTTLQLTSPDSRSYRKRRRRYRRRVMNYLQQNKPAVEHAISVGAGESVAELATILGVPEQDVPRFGQAMRRVHSNLHDVLAQEKLDETSTDVFLLTIAGSFLTISS